MARNPVQFQKGISLNAFLSLYGTEDQCFDALYQWRWPNGFVCPHCGHDRCCQLNSRKLQQCNRCHRQTSITAGTIFDSTKLPLTVWFQAIYLITQDVTAHPPASGFEVFVTVGERSGMWLSGMVCGWGSLMVTGG